MAVGEVTELVIFCCLMVLWLIYTVAYFFPKFWHSKFRVGARRHHLVNLWHTAMHTRDTWARDLMRKADDARGAALLAVQQMRNVIVSCTLLVMGIAQIMGRLVVVMTTDSQLATIDRIVRNDPMTGPDSWVPAYVRVAVPFGATLASLLCFGQAVRLAVHIGFNIRVRGVTQGDAQFEQSLSYSTGDDSSDGSQALLFEDEVVVMLQRCELYFTLGLRFMYLFIGTVFWVLGTTALLVSSLTVLIALALSDVLVVPSRQPKCPHARRKGCSSPPL